jgi:glutamate-ammonia-ligase adenylyltransferase
MKEDVEIKLAPLPFADAIDRAAAFSPFLRGLITRRADVVAIVEGQGLPAALAWAEAASADDPDTARALRRERQAVALSVALADLAGAPFETVTRALSDFADHALDRAIAPRSPSAAATCHHRLGRARTWQAGQPRTQLFVGHRSDPAVRSRNDLAPPARGAGRGGTALSRAGSSNCSRSRPATAMCCASISGLRPASEATPLAVPIGLAISHYESSALPWERAAFIRARSAAGDIALGAEMLDHLRPFVWRRALDYRRDRRDTRSLAPHPRSSRQGPRRRRAMTSSAAAAASARSNSSRRSTS